ncbi:MAG: GTP-binding protein [Promethearchaeota archaeon]|nr:MAG: GTP-binding protein [Candidatus Lokiarchaeota archaeon]
MDVYSLKMVLAGAGSVGKTALVDRYVNRLFKPAQGADYTMTIGVEPMGKKIVTNEYIINLSIFDFGGQPHFSFVRKALYQGANAVMFVFDLTNTESLYKLSDFFKEHKENNMRYKTSQVILVGNKADLEEQIGVVIEQKTIDDFIEDNPDGRIINYIKTSAKDSTNVDQAFNYLAYKALRAMGHQIKVYQGQKVKDISEKI